MSGLYSTWKEEDRPELPVRRGSQIKVIQVSQVLNQHAIQPFCDIEEVFAGSPAPRNRRV